MEKIIVEFDKSSESDTMSDEVVLADLRKKFKKSKRDVAHDATTSHAKVEDYAPTENRDVETSTPSPSPPSPEPVKTSEPIDDNLESSNSDEDSSDDDDYFGKDYALKGN